jgi:hypothetical protein
METKTNIYSILNEIQVTLEAPKNQFNKFGNYKYRNCEDILEALKPLLKELKSVIIISDSIEVIQDRFYVKATAKLIEIEGGTFVENIAYAREELTKKGMDGAQVTGATSSYARKYALNGLLLVDDSKDADSMDNSKEEAPQQQQDNDDKPWLNAGAELNSLIARAKQDGLTGDETLKLGRTKYKINKKLSEEIKEALK